MKNLAVQLWSVKQEMEQDVRATLRAVSELGFAGVEFAGFFGVPAAQMRGWLDEYGLRVAGSHTGFDEIVRDTDAVIAYNRTIGNRNIVCPHYDLTTPERLRTLAAGLQSALPKLRDNGMTLHYHNHDHEFVKVGERFLLEQLFAQMPELHPQIDTYWVYRAGVDVEAFCMQYKGRCRLIHLKDGTQTASKPIGEGAMDIPAVLKTAAALDVEWVILEDETFQPDGMTCVKQGMENLKRMGYVE